MEITDINNSGAKLVAFSGREVLVDKASGHLPQGRYASASDDCPISVLSEEPLVVALDADSFKIEPETPCEFVDLRVAANRMTPAERRLAAKGRELLFWDSETRFCGHCGALMRRATEISKVCGRCGREVFPHVSPAVIVLIKRGEQALLAHNCNFRGGMHGLIAGYLEAGESLEECVHREIREETGLEVENIRYFGSQPWPFPSNLMIGFTADWKSGELTFADGELDAGDFFSRDNLPPIPTPPSIARRLIDAWLADGPSVITS